MSHGLRSRVVVAALLACAASAPGLAAAQEPARQPPVITDVVYGHKDGRVLTFDVREYGVDPNRIGVLGGSAGGQLALLLGTTADPGDPSASDPVLRESSRVAAVVAFFPPTDLFRWVNKRFFPATAALTETEAAQYSPLRLVSPSAAPSLIVHGDVDNVVPIVEGETMYAALSKAGVSASFVRIEGAGHAFEGASLTRANGEMVRWFEQHLVSPPRARQTEPLAFEVTSVKPNRTGDRSSRFQLLPGGRFVATNTTVRALLQSAYRFDYLPFQVIGGPSWLDSERFDVEGRAGSDSVSPSEVDAMVRSLLVSRFKLAYAKETRDLPVYHLEVARDGRRGPRLRESSTPCDRTPIGVNTPAPADAPPRCGARFARSTVGQKIEGIGATLDELAQRLSGPSQRIVVNRTRLEGVFDYELEFTPDNNQTAAADTGLALFTALQEQLGLRLEPARGPVDVLVVQSAERPEEN